MRKNKIIGACLGTIVEFYDYSLYAFAANIIGDKFFPELDPVAKLTNVFAIYACGYAAKPFGAIIFGRLGDYFGRKTALSISMIGIAIPTMIIGILPEYSSIGIFSTFILVACRFMQALFIAGEYDGAAIYVIEHLGKNYQHTASSVVRTTGAIGFMLGIGSINFFTSRVFFDFAWRIPFLLSIPLALLTIYYRKGLDETADFKKSKQEKIKITKFVDIIKYNWSTIIIVIFLAGGFGVTYQISTIFMRQYLPIIIPSTKLIISGFSIAIFICFTIAMPISGLIADKFGITRVIQVCTFFTLFGSALLYLAAKYQTINLALVACIIIGIFVAPYNALAHSAIINKFKVTERYRAIALGHTMGSVLMSGTANYVCLKFISYDMKFMPIFYLAFFSVLAYFMFMLLKSLKIGGQNLIE